MGDSAADAPNRSRLSSILLARQPHFTDSTNDTTATAKSKDGYTMAVSFWMADPPQLSLFSIHCLKPPGSRYTMCSDFLVSPHVVGADGPFVLLRVGFYAGAGSREYFLYKAAGDAPPSLERIPSPRDLVSDDDDLSGVREFGILGHGGHYLVAALRDAPSSSDEYQLRIYSSERKSWITRALQNPCPGVDRVIPDKVITLGQGGLLGWVDLSLGLLVCDLLRLQYPDTTGGGGGGGVSFFIPMPEPLPGNRYKEKYPIPPSKKMKNHPLGEEPSRSASWFRDLACVNGVLKFIEMENPAPPENKDNTISDPDLIMWLKRKAVDRNSKQHLSSFRNSWRAVTWSRKVSSADFWRQTCAAPVANIKGSEQFLTLIKEQVVTFRDLYSAFPTLSPADDGHDILYLKSLVEPSHRDGFVAALDIGNKELKIFAQYYLPDDWYYSHRFNPEHPFRACTLSTHMDITPGIHVSAFRKITEASSSADQPGGISVCGSQEPSSPRSKFQRVFDLAEEIKHGRNPPESIIQNDHISSQVHPVVNNLPRQKCFNKPDGPCGPGFASLAPIHALAPVHGLHNYQPLWPPFSASSAFGPHEAPPSCFNNFSGDSYHGYYLQQLSAPSPCAYGTYTGYSNYQQQWQQLTPTRELPIGASWQHSPPPVQRQPTPHEEARAVVEDATTNDLKKRRR